MKLILFGIYGLIVCLAILVIMKLREKRFSSGSVIDEAQNRDFLDDFADAKRNSLAQSPWNMSYETYVTIGVVSTIILAVLAYVLYANLIITIIAAVIGLFVPEAIVQMQARSRKSHFEERYARGLRQLSAGLKSGMSLHQAINDVSHSPFVHETVRREFRQLDADLKLGIPIKDAFERFADRVKCQDAYDVAIAISMQLKVGGREAEVVETVARNISDRLMLRKEVSSLFAGSNMTVWALDIIPFAIVAFLFLFSPQYVAPYFESLELQIMLVTLLIFMSIGTVFTHKLIIKMRKECGIQ